MKVMVVDDVGVIRHSMQRMLVERGFDVVTTASGTDAVGLLTKDNAVGAVITDLLMPGMNGVELFKSTRKIQRFTDAGELPPPDFILMTALRPTSDAHRKEASLLKEAETIGFVDILTKPIDKQRLFGHLDKIQKLFFGLTGGVAPPVAETQKPERATTAPATEKGQLPGKDWWTELEKLQETLNEHVADSSEEQSQLKERLQQLQTQLESSQATS